ncbi:MAG: hypothetical protein CK532_07040 [Flavobacteriales bacterium]|nr:MAG: hypothetical protein CK532_07040 [Flavobacteriales bacterium]
MGSDMILVAQSKQLALQSLVYAENSMLQISPLIISGESDSIKLAAAESLQKQLFANLATRNSFDYSFERLRISTVAIAKHPKANTRIFSFNVILKNGIFYQYGIVQRLGKNKEIQRFLLRDTAQDLPTDCLDISLIHPDWIGGLYYQLIPHTVNHKEYFIVLAFDGHNQNSNRSIIDVLYFENNEMHWGAPLFREGIEDPSEAMRVVFEYHKSARILMRWEENKKIIVFDEIGPSYPDAKNNPFLYVPTGDYSAYRASKHGVFTKETLDITDFGQGITPNFNHSKPKIDLQDHP